MNLIEAFKIDNNLVEDSKIIVYKVSENQKEEMTRREKIENILKFIE